MARRAAIRYAIRHMPSTSLMSDAERLFERAMFVTRHEQVCLPIFSDGFYDDFATPICFTYDEPPLFMPAERKILFCDCCYDAHCRRYRERRIIIVYRAAARLERHAPMPDIYMSREMSDDTKMVTASLLFCLRYAYYATARYGVDIERKMQLIVMVAYMSAASALLMRDTPMPLRHASATMPAQSERSMRHYDDALIIFTPL